MKFLMKLENLITFSNFCKIRDIILFVLDSFGINEIFRIKNKNKYIILWYHGISHRVINFSKRHVAISEFENEIKYLKKKNYTFINLTDLISILQNKKKPKKRYIILTFDDGFKNVIKNAYPILKKYAVKGCLYIVTDIIDNDKLVWTDYIEVLVRNSLNLEFRFVFNNQNIYYELKNETDIQKTCNDIKSKLRSLSNSERLIHLNKFKNPNNISSFKIVPQEYIMAKWSDLIALNRNILEIGCHTKTHPNLETLKSDIEFYQELKESKDKIESKMGYEINHLCYPAGSFNNIVIQNVKKFDYKTATTTIEGLNNQKTDLFQLKRLQMKNNHILFKAKISGFYFFIKNVFKILK